MKTQSPNAVHTSNRRVAGMLTVASRAIERVVNRTLRRPVADPMRPAKTIPDHVNAVIPRIAVSPSSPPYPRA